jgi:transcriptional regulator with XRE-family HTH domain
MMGTDDDVRNETLADVIRRIRGGMKQTEFAELVGISSSMVGHVEAGTRSLSVESLDQIADALELPETERRALRHARERKSSELTTKQRGGLVPPDRVQALADQVEALAERVRDLSDEVARMKRSGRRGSN